MASFSVPCQKATTVITASHPNKKMNQQQHQQQQQHCSVSFQWSSPALLARSSLRFKGSRHNQSDVFKVFSQLNDVCCIFLPKVAAKKSSNSAPVSDTKSEEPVKESAAPNTVPDAASISAFMTQVADIVELVDSRDVTELHLMQRGCELIIRKKKALLQLCCSSNGYDATTFSQSYGAVSTACSSSQCSCFCRSCFVTSGFRTCATYPWKAKIIPFSPEMPNGWDILLFSCSRSSLFCEGRRQGPERSGSLHH